MGRINTVEPAHSAFKKFPEHWQVASRAIELLQADERVLGLYLSGSFAKGKPDRWSDIDFYVLVSDGAEDEVIRSHERLFREVADVATLFPATHLGDPHQIIVFYRSSEPIHVDYQYRALGALKPQKKDSSVIILLDRAGELVRWREACRREPAPPGPTTEQLQYFEDRFWGWCWYAHTKIERGELWEARDMVEYLRSHVLLPLAHREGQLFEGNRRVEDKFPDDIQRVLAETVASGHSASGYRKALDSTMHAYSQLFDSLPVEARAEVRQVDRDYVCEALPD
jgi:predicted nucleotidyltransferase